MTNRFKMTVAAAALLAGTGFAYAQGTGMSQGGTQGGASTQQSSPSTERGGATQQMNHGATQGMGSSQSEERSPASGNNQRAQESTKGDRSKGMSSENETRGRNKEMNAEGHQDRNNQKAEGRENRNHMRAEDRQGQTNQNAERREDRNNMKAEGREGRTGNMNAEKGGAEGRTVGQAGAGAKLSTEQRTKITSVIKNEHVAPVNNVNFSVAVGTRVPHNIAFHPLPQDVVTIYPEWRGYNFVLVRDEIVVIDPDTYEIVAVINS